MATVLAAVSLVAFVGLLPGADAPAPSAAPTFQKYCLQCHGNEPGMGGVSLKTLTAGPVSDATFPKWQRVVTALEANRMPPKGMPQPSDEEKQHALAWVKSELSTYAHKNAGDPGKVTVRRLTGAEYGYTIKDLTGLDLDLTRDLANDSVGGEGFMNFGDVQFMQDAGLERYLEAAKTIADHAVIGAGPLEFFNDPGQTGFELSAITRIKDIYGKWGLRTVSGEGGVSFGLDKYTRAFYVAWQYQHRAELGQRNATLESLAKAEGLSPVFAQHVWSVLNRPTLGYPLSEVAARWKKLPAPTADAKLSERLARAGAEDLQKFTTTWPSWLFVRGDIAAGGAGDESPLIFSDKTLMAETSHHFLFNSQGGPGGRGRAMTAGPRKVYFIVAPVNPGLTAKPSIIWRNATVGFRQVPAGRGGATVATGPTKSNTNSTEQTSAASPAQVQAAQAALAVARGRGPSGPRIPLKTVLDQASAARLGLGKGPEGVTMGASDFASDGSVSFDVSVPEGTVGFDVQVDAEIAGARDQVLRITVSERADGGAARGTPPHALLGDPSTATYKAFKAGVMELATLLPPNTYSEPTPADKDPPPAPFDPAYNTPEHDAFDTQVKYLREDGFLVSHMIDQPTRKRLDEAWSDLKTSFEYYDAYLSLLAAKFKYDLKDTKMATLTRAQVDAMPQELRQWVAPLRNDYLETTAVEAAAVSRHLDDCLRFAGSAWRRPLTEAEKASLRTFYKSVLAGEKDHRKAIRAVLTRILVSPSFLYRIELAADSSAPKPLSDWELAGRLSYFLWSSIPDDELRRAAGAGELSNPKLLQAQVKRMLADAKARRFATEFFGQWLGFYRFDQFKGVDTGRFPEFTDAVRSAMYDESVSFFEYVVRQNRPVSDILFADYSFLNQPLAKYYGVQKEVKSTGAAEKVEGSNEFNRGGLLRLGSVLTVTSAPLRTSPVKRGDWVLRRILGTPVPPPPADAGSIPADDKLFGAMTLREKLAAHKRNATCAGCHTRIDPLGFPLEHYDSTGRWREKYVDGKEIYDGGTLTDNTEISGAKGLLNYLRTKQDQVRRTLSYKMIGYALGRTVLPSDTPLIDEMVAAGGDATIADLAARITSSRQFRNRPGRELTAGSRTVAQHQPSGLSPHKDPAAPVVKQVAGTVRSSNKAGTE
ncbi:MAG TPA: DUF1592 domain-containing protein [Bryobacteraceae bacterium]|nr:DUF1592 domain-containing protein [Bryobacteraceae bacterium]